MAEMEIKHFPNPILRKKCEDVKSIGSDEKKTLSDMAETMYLKGGVGLAAIQVGIRKNMLVMDIGDGLIKMINPVISKKEGSVAQEEGCLSVPKKCVTVKRAQKIVVDYLNENGQAVRLSAEGLLARVAQHEVDHLFGKLIIDYLNPLKKICNSLTTRKL
jgi:peptide deformylase